MHFLIGERPIARRVDDSVVRAGVSARQSCGVRADTLRAQSRLFPRSVRFWRLGADLKNTVTLVVDGQAFVSQHIGDLDHYQAFRAFQETIDDLVAMYEVRSDDLLIVHDAHPQYVSTLLSRWT